MTRMISFIECEKVHDKTIERAECYINPTHVVYIEGDEECEGYTYIGLVNGSVTIVKGCINEVREKLEGRRWLKTLHLQ